MFDSPIFDSVFGLIIVYVVLSIIVSSIQECAAGLLQLRSKTLRKGIENLVGNEHAAQIYRHGLIRGLSRKRANWIDDVTNRGSPRMPSNIPAATFSVALTDVMTADRTGTAPTLDDIQDAIARMEDADLRSALTALLSQTEAGVDEFQGRAAVWFDDAMDRIQGWYVRTARIWSLGVAAVLVVALNADSLHMGKVIWDNDSLRTRLIALAPTGPKPANDEIDKILAALPLGWPCSKPRRDTGESFCVISKGEKDALPGSAPLPRLIGWLLTVFAVSLGAPFWFDLMTKLAHLRNAGKPPRRAAAVGT